MKHVHILLSILIVALTNCKEEDPEIELTAQQSATRLLSVSWGSAEVVSSPVAGANGNLSNLTLTFSAAENYQPTAFSSSGAPDYFLSDGSSTWTWETTGTISRILLSNVSPVQELTVDNLTETTLLVSFAFAGPAGGRAAGIGEYQIKLSRL